MNRVVGVVVLVVLALLAVACRTVTTYSVVFPEPGLVRLVDTDSYFHLRHAGHALRHFPHLNRQDTSWEYPRNTRTDGAGLFDIGLAALTLVTGGSGEHRLMVVAAWYPVLIFVLALGALYALARRVLPEEHALWVVAALLMYPGLALPISSLGYCDHHVAEIFLGLTVVLGFTRLLEPPPGNVPAMGRASLCALPLVVFFFTWIGAPLYVPILSVAALAVLTADAVTDQDGAGGHRAPVLARYALAAFVPVALIALVAPSLVMEARALYHGLVALAVLAALGYAHRALIVRATTAGLGPRARGYGAAALIVGAGTLVILGTERGRVLASYLLAPKSEFVTEHAPLSASLAFTLLGIPGLMALLGWPAVIASARDPQRRATLVPATVAVVLTGLWVISRDYGYQIPAFSVLLAGLGVRAGAHGLPARLRQPWVARGVAGVVLAIPLLGLSSVVRPWMPAHILREIQNVDRGWEQAMSWMRTGTPLSGMPAEDLPPDAPPGPSYGVASAWDRGNLIGVLGQRRAVWSRFPQPRSAEFFTDINERSSIRHLYRRTLSGEKVRYVVVDGQSVSSKFITWILLAKLKIEDYLMSASSVTYGGMRYAPASYGAPWRNAVSVRLYYLDGEDLERYRLVYESPHRSCHYYLVSLTGGNVLRLCVPEESLREELKVPPSSGPLRLPEGIVHDVSLHSTVKVFEVVEGARVRGRAKPGTPVEIELECLTTTTMRRFRKYRKVVAKPDGRFSVRLPYASTGTPADAVVRAAGPYRIRGQDAAGQAFDARFDVSEDAVVKGTVIDLAR